MEPVQKRRRNVLIGTAAKVIGLIGGWHPYNSAILLLWAGAIAYRSGATWLAWPSFALALIIFVIMGITDGFAIVRDVRGGHYSRSVRIGEAIFFSALVVLVVLDFAPRSVRVLLAVPLAVVLLVTFFIWTQ